MNIEDLPTKGDFYGSGEAILELCTIVDNVMKYEKDRCDCDSHSRCIHCRLESELSFKKEALKKRMQEFIDLLQQNDRK